MRVCGRVANMQEGLRSVANTTHNSVPAPPASIALWRWRQEDSKSILVPEQVQSQRRVHETLSQTYPGYLGSGHTPGILTNVVLATERL